MKFRGRIVDVVCIQQFSKIVHTVSKLAKDVTLRITTDCIYFILNEDAVSGGGWLWADIPQETLFQEYNMQGVSEEFNEIYLDIVADHIVKALKSAAASKSLKVKLTKRQTPCLSFEIELPSLVSTSRTVVHDVPVSVIPRRLWNNFAQPAVEEGDIVTHMPSLKVMKNVVDKMKNLSSYATLTISSDHGMTVSVQTDMVTVTTHFKGLQFPLSGKSHRTLNQGIWEAKGTKLGHSHQYAQSSDTEVDRLGSHELGCANKGVPLLLEDKIHEVSTELREHPQPQHIQKAFTCDESLSLVTWHRAATWNTQYKLDDGTSSHDGAYEARIDLRKLVPVLLAQQLNPRQVTCTKLTVHHSRPCNKFIRSADSMQFTTLPEQNESRVDHNQC